MRNFGFLSISFIFAGCFLGAGFLSGNELIQFFGKFGFTGIIMLILTVIGLCFFGYMILCIAVDRKTTVAKDIIVPRDKKTFGNIFSYIQCIPVFAISVIMSAGAGTIVYETLGIQKILSSLLFCVVLYIMTVIDAKFTALFFSFTIPLICLLSLVLLILSILNAQEINMNLKSQPNALLSTPFLSAILYMSYSIFSSLGSIAALSGKNYSRKKYFAAIILGGVTLIIIALSVVLCLGANPEAVENELPMVSVAFKFGKFLGCLYSYLLLCGMLGAALNCQISVYNTIVSNLKKQHSYLIALLLAVLTFLLSMSPFGELVGTVYPIIGFGGIAVLALIVINYVKGVNQLSD